MYAKTVPWTAHWARAPQFEIFFWFVFVKFDCIIGIWFKPLVVNIKYVQYVFDSLIFLQEYRACVKRKQNNPQTPKNSSAPGPRPPVLNFLDPPLICVIWCHKFSWLNGGKSNIKTYARLSLEWGLLSVPHPMWRGTSVNV